MESKHRGQAYGLLFFTFFIWGSVYVGGRLGSGDLPPGLVACRAPPPWPRCSSWPESTWGSKSTGRTGNTSF